MGIFVIVSFVLSLFPRDVLDEIWDLIESVSEGFPIFFYFNDSLSGHFSLYRAISQMKEKEKKYNRGEQNIKVNPRRTYYSTVGPVPVII